jgi:hypothetical protein
MKYVENRETDFIKFDIVKPHTVQKFQFSRLIYVKTYRYFPAYLLTEKLFRTKVEDKNVASILFPKKFLLQSYGFWDN